MTDLPSSFSPIQLHNRLNRPVWLGIRRVQRDGRELVFLTASTSGLVSKNFETFAGQVVREFHLDPAQTDFIEVRGDGEEWHWIRWHAQWVGSAPMECRSEEVVAVSSRRYLEQALEQRTEAA
ncbi:MULTISPECIES: hypothetical protein [Microbulbifer]|uniref:hypothetical protein n=1 Tax=Microbulbifer TaxID=48073 RepID=UPI001E5F0944|nr:MULTISPECIES: hypothetical protein [Microbulbifer]UHQ56428.1 hypothetical protein LVE68_05465 [Microbulbifer sp. YPW16]